VGINYDRVLEDRSLIRERIVGAARPSRLAQASTVMRYLGMNTLRLFTGRLRRYGRAAVNFGTPVSVRAWLQAQPDPVLDLPREERLPRIQVLAELGMERVGAVIPVTSVALVAAAVLSFGASVVPRAALLERLDELRDSLREVNAKLVRRELPVTEIWDRAWRMLRMRRLAVAEGELIIILPGQRPLLEYYANSIRHLLPPRYEVTLSPAREGDSTLPRLAAREEGSGLGT
jgi:glycerol-3-phosphate O-acyltransferase